MHLSIDPESVKGFLAPEEGKRLYELALEAALLGPCLEVGSYCGRSTIYLGSACKKRQQLLYAVDHHRGSEEHQPGEEYHDPELLDSVAGKMDSFRTFRATLVRADLENFVVPLVASSELAGRHWQTPLAMCLSTVVIASKQRRLTTLRGRHTYARAGFSLYTIYFPIRQMGDRLPMKFTARR